MEGASPEATIFNKVEPTLGAKILIAIPTIKPTQAVTLKVTIALGFLASIKKEPQAKKEPIIRKNVKRERPLSSTVSIPNAKANIAAKGMPGCAKK